MSKKILIPNKKEIIFNLKDKIDSFILGLKNLSVNLPCYFELE